MKLKSLSYIEHRGKPEEWQTKDCSFGNINLIVGRNATGKTRTLNIIRGLSDIVTTSQNLKYSTGSYSVSFSDGDSLVKYNLEYEDAIILKESFAIDGQVLLERHEDGTGQILLQSNEQVIAFQTGINQIAVASKRDLIQHPYLEKIYDWGNGLIKYEFGSKLGRDTIGVAPPGVGLNVTEEEPDPKDTSKAIAIFRKGLEKHGEQFVQTIINDMMDIGYNISDVGTAELQGVNLPEQLKGKPFGLFVKENDLRSKTYQHSISAGMFRSLSIIIQITYSLLSGEPSCILIDDIGEGLDYSRSSDLLKLLIDKIKDSNTQLIMSTNDRFVMNSVPMEHWIILERKRWGEVVEHNYTNSKDLFDDFALTGLNNFDFLTSNYILKKTSTNSE